MYIRNFLIRLTFIICLPIRPTPLQERSNPPGFYLFLQNAVIYRISAYLLAGMDPARTAHDRTMFFRFLV